MKAPTVAGLTVLPIVIISLALPAFAQTPPNQDMDKDELHVSLKSPISLDAVLSVFKKRSFDSAILQSNFSIGGRAVQDFVTIFSGEQVPQIQKRWMEGRRSIVDELNRSGFSTVVQPSQVFPDSDSLVTGFTVRSDVATVADISKQFTDATIEHRSGNNVPRSGRPSQVVPNDAAISPLAAANTPYYTFLPVSGSVITGLFTVTGLITTPTRGVVNYMFWNSNRFASDQTYEHDFFLSSNLGTYFARNFSTPPGCYPKAVYAATSWPSSSYPYLDSDLESSLTSPCTSVGNIAYTIGAAQANAITAGVSHFTAILMPSGDASTDTFLLQGQVGYQNPIGWHGALYSYPYGYGVKETTHYNFIKSGTVPGTQNWTMNGYLPDTPINLSITSPAASSLRINFTDVTWDETNVIVERSTGGTSGPWTTYNFGILNAGNVAGNWYWINSGLGSKLQYCYRMKTSNAIGSSPYTPVLCGTTL